MKAHRLIIIGGVILAAAFSRLIPHPPNFTPIVPMALFGGAYLADRRLAIALIFGSMFVSDVFLGFHETWIAVYLALGLIILIGERLHNHVSVKSVASTTFASSCLFFVITNFGVWLIQNMYPKNLAGLGECFTAALPFFQTQILGDLFFSAVIFGAFAFSLEGNASSLLQKRSE